MADFAFFSSCMREEPKFVKINCNLWQNNHTAELQQVAEAVLDHAVNGKQLPARALSKTAAHLLLRLKTAVHATIVSNALLLIFLVAASQPIEQPNNRNLKQKLDSRPSVPLGPMLFARTIYSMLVLHK